MTKRYIELYQFNYAKATSSTFSLDVVGNQPTYDTITIIALQRSKAWNTKYYQYTFLIISRLLHDISEWSTRNEEA